MGSALNFQSLNHYNSATDCSISLTLGRQFDHVTTDTLRTFTVKGSKVKVTKYQGVSSKTL